MVLSVLRAAMTQDPSRERVTQMTGHEVGALLDYLAAAEVSAVNSVDDRPIACPGPMTTAIGEEYHKAIRGQTARYKDWVEHVS